jgi:hypothetical protein
MAPAVQRIKDRTSSGTVGFSAAGATLVLLSDRPGGRDTDNPDHAVYRRAGGA